MFDRLREDLRATRRNDPAARSVPEILLCTPGLHALWSHRFAHRLWRWRLRLVARLLSQLARWATGVEIHPGATIGRRVVIDHGMGIVIGETAEIGDDVVVYQGVTLGGVSRKRVKRHPTVENDVVIGANAVLLGPIRICRGARIGAGVVIRGDVGHGEVIVTSPAPPEGLQGRQTRQANGVWVRSLEEPPPS